MDEADFAEQESSWNVVDSVYYVFGNYGWHLLIVFIVLTIIYNKSLKYYIEKYRDYKFEREYSAKYHKNPDVFAAHVNAQQDWAEKMQEKYNKQSEEYQKKMKEKEEKKKEELRAKFENTGCYVLGGSKPDDKQNNLKPAYNPLTGAGNSSSYRPPRRSPCGGGGCGR